MQKRVSVKESFLARVTLYLVHYGSIATDLVSPFIVSTSNSHQYLVMGVIVWFTKKQVRGKANDIHIGM